MIVKKIVEKLRNKGYDDFYLADLADTYDVGLFFIMLFLQLFMFVLILGAWFEIIKLLLDIDGNADIGSFVFFVSPLLLPYLCHAMIKDLKKKGETELRLRYMVSSRISKIIIKAIRYAPLISAFLFVVFLIYAFTRYGFYGKMLSVFALNLLLLLIFARPYQKLLARVKKEAEYFVDWKTHHEVEHIEETYSCHEKWHIASAEMSFEKFNIDHFRNICVFAFVSASVGLLAGLFYILSFSPMMLKYDKAESLQIEQLNKESLSNKTGEVNSDNTVIQSQNMTTQEVEEPVTIEQQEEVSMTNEEDVKNLETGEELSEETSETKDGMEHAGKLDEKQEAKRYYRLSELDVIPSMSDGEYLQSGVEKYLVERFPVLEENSIAIQVNISATGKIEHTVVNGGDLRINDSIRKRMEETLLSMPNIVPGKKEGQAVCVFQYINVNTY